MLLPLSRGHQSLYDRGDWRKRSEKVSEREGEREGVNGVESEIDGLIDRK